MAIKIQTKQTYVPVILGDLELKFDISDESILKLEKSAGKVKSELEKVKVTSKNEEEALEKSKQALKKGYDFLFGEGTFEKVYELSPSVAICAEYFEQIALGLFEELEKRGFSKTTQSKVQKYLNK